MNGIKSKSYIMVGTAWKMALACLLMGALWGCGSELDVNDSTGPRCGNGVVEDFEGCDDGNGDLTDACPDGSSGSCQPAVCGDGYLAPTEACDDGPLNSETAPDACRSIV